ncbi:regulatory protein RecX [Ferrimonas lipolytica]|uniref:Regulatory protein RecX n=1 Tax=Ferrimonas lipolytica TaxID=2724191 RepID=A0A6H1U948_9GAMM|nr:regulatory protein RecX [Ferrimonas lipolytica]QIZ75567.1 regulatory protein RecX [Ferrimonas lipolytica]
MGLLSRRDHSRGELQRKMHSRGFSSEQIEAAIGRVIDFGYLDDERFAHSFVRYRSQRGLGPQRLRSDLRERQVDTELIKAALAQTEVDFFESCLALRQRKFGEALPADFKERAKQQRYLAYRGFSMDMIRYALSPSE